MVQEFNERLAEVEKTVAVTNANVGNILTMVTDIKAYLAKSAEQRVTMLEKLAVITNKQDDFVKYQLQCDEERQSLDKRVDKVETNQRNQKKIAVGIAAFISFLAYGGGKAVEKIGAWFAS